MTSVQSLNHSKVLLHLKWFVNRLGKSFESKLLNYTSRHQYSEKPCSFSLWNSLNNMESSELIGRSPFSQSKFGQKLKLRSNSNDGDRFSSAEQSPITRRRFFGQRKDSDIEIQNRSPFMKTRSLTNSPFMKHIPIAKNLLRKRMPLSENSNSNSELDSTHSQDSIPSLPLNKLSIESLVKHNQLSDKSFPPFCDMGHLRLLLILKTSSEVERISSITKFAQHICIVYEYQLGFLQGLKAVHAAADYIADLIIKAIQIGRIASLSQTDLTVTLLYDTSCRPVSQSKCVKTAPLPGTGEQLTWKISEIWTRPGLRHNEVGGENCHNLNIVTHFLAPFSSILETKRPDIYGYRNLIVHPFRASSTVPSGNAEGVYENTSDAIVVENENSTKITHFEISTFDEEVILASNVRTGTPENIKNASATRQKMDPVIAVRRDQIHRSQLERSLATSLKPPLIAGSLNLRQHLHRAYRPVFFLIYERPTVINHLTECESFAAFCKRQNIFSIMFLNQDTDLFDGKTCPTLFQNFDIFRVTSTGYVNNALKDGIVTASNVVNIPAKQLKLSNGNSTSHDVCLTGFDNPGFIS